MGIQGKTVVLTGDFKSLTRAEASAKLEALGHRVAGSVSTRTDYVFAGASAGGKLDKARALGVCVLDEAALLAVLSGGDLATVASPAAVIEAPEVKVKAFARGLARRARRAGPQPRRRGLVQVRRTQRPCSPARDA